MERPICKWTLIRVDGKWKFAFYDFVKGVR